MDTIRREGEINLHDTNVTVWQEHVDDVAMQAVWRSVSLADGMPITTECAERLFVPTADMPRRRVLTKQDLVAKFDSAIRRAMLRKDDRRAERIRGALATLHRDGLMVEQ